MPHGPWLYRNVNRGETMKNTISTGLVVLAASWGSVGATSFDGSQPLLCDAATVIECLPVEGCRQVAAEAIAAPSFMRVDLAKKW